ncbi:TPA: type II secretion system protein GspI [Candidatus Poribacteria bacterium]|nr:type II secretion system protein GspI [Candidatus Poribacteria bacterium]
MSTRRLKKTHTYTFGFTLIEILVSLTILAIALPPLLRAFSQAGNQSASSENETTAVNLLKYKMAEIEMLGYPEGTGEDEGEFGEGSRFGWTSRIEETDTEGLLLISVTVNWLERGREKSMTMNTYMADRQLPQEETSQEQSQGGGGR